MKSDQKQERAGVLDELGRLLKEIAAEHAALHKKLGTKMERAAMLEAQVLGWYATSSAHVPFAPEGQAFVALVSARTNVTIITNMLRVQKLLGAEKFRHTCKVGIGELRKLLTQEQLAACTRTERSGPRTLRVVEKSVEKSPEKSSIAA
jgi:hypothetical protein